MKKVYLNSKNYPSLKQFPPINKKIVFVSGVFNVLHPGHLRLLDFASTLGDFLIVGVLGKNLVPENTIPEKERISIILELKKVDIAIILMESPEEYINKLKPDIVVKGKEHENQFNAEEKILKKNGGKLIFSSGETKSTFFESFNESKSKFNHNSILKSENFQKKHDFNSNSLIKVLDDFEKIRVLVIGDTIIDEYVDCDPVGISQEDPTIVVRPNESKFFLGGASIVAAHAKSLGANVEYITILGNDDLAKFYSKKIEKTGLKFKSYIDFDRPTTHKKRFRAHGHTLLRVHNYIQQPISNEIKNKILKDVNHKITNTDLIVFSDFNYGMLSQELVNEIIYLANKNKVLIVADSQSSSQIGDISRFIGSKLVTPTEREARIAIKDFSSGLVTVAEKLMVKAGAEYVFITLGEEGVLIHQKTKNKNDWRNDMLPAFNKSPIDPAGAGDALLITSSLALASGSNIWKAAYLGSIAAACQVGRLGNLPLTKKELFQEINK